MQVYSINPFSTLTAPSDFIDQFKCGFTLVPRGLYILADQAKTLDPRIAKLKREEKAAKEAKKKEKEEAVRKAEEEAKKVRTVFS